MSARSRSPGSSRRNRAPPQSASSPIDRTHVHGQMQEIFVVVKALRDEKAVLEKQLQSISARGDQEEKRIVKELSKSRIDLENLAELFRHAADGIDTKSTANIPELPEAAVAKVVPRGLRPLLEAEYGEHASVGTDIQQEIDYTRGAMNDTFSEYERMAEASKGLIWDVERLNLIIQAYETDLVKLKADGSEIKADINAMRLKWRYKFAACRRWQDFTRRSHVLKFQNQLDGIQDAFDVEQADTERELESLLEMIGTIRMKDNKVKLTLFMKKMKNAVVYKMWRGWMMHHKMCQEEKYGLDMDALSAAEAAKLAAMKNAETAAMLTCFLKRWQNRKIAVPFMTWSDITLAKREARLKEALEAERAALLAKMQALEGSAVAQKLKLIFAKIAGKMKDLTFRALLSNMQQARIARMGEDERFKRLKVFLEQKLKGVKYSTFQCLAREARQLMAARIKNNSMAKRVGAFLEMKIKGIKFAIVSAFKRHAKENAADNAEARRLAALMSERDTQSMQRLKIFLQGKEMRLKYAFFSFWVQCMAGSTQSKMMDILEGKRKEREAMEKKLQDMERQLGGGRLDGDLDRQLEDAADAIQALERKAASMRQGLEAAKARYNETEAALDAEKQARREDKSKIKALDIELQDVTADKDGLAEELKLIVDQIEFLSQASRS